MMKRQKKIAALLLACALVIGMSGCQKKQEGVTRLVLDWTPNTNHTGFFVALEKGYYEEAGLTVEIMQPPEETALTLLAAGNCEFAIGFQESMGPSFASANPLPVKAVAALIQHNTSGILSLKSAGIESPAGLAGKRYATWGSDFVTEVIRGIVEADGGDFSAVKMVTNNATDAISALQTDIDAIWVYFAWDAIAAQVAGLDFNYIPLQEYVPALDFYTPVLVSSDAFLKEHPEQAKAFLAATAKGFEFAIQHPDEAAEILLKHAPELSRELVVQSQRWLAGQYKAEVERWGEIDPKRWAAFYDWQYEKGLLEKQVGAGGFTNEYLPE